MKQRDAPWQVLGVSMFFISRWHVSRATNYLGQKGEQGDPWAQRDFFAGQAFALNIAGRSATLAPFWRKRCQPPGGSYAQGHASGGDPTYGGLEAPSQIGGFLKGFQAPVKPYRLWCLSILMGPFPSHVAEQVCKLRRATRPMSC